MLKSRQYTLSTEGVTTSIVCRKQSIKTLQGNLDIYLKYRSQFKDTGSGSNPTTGPTVWFYMLPDFGKPLKAFLVCGRFSLLRPKYSTRLF